jgi:predicted HD superfamily hydrolase involved in NAD metabolism
MPPYHQLERMLKDRVTKRRFLHSVRVRDTAAALAGIYRCDREKAEAAGLLHDVARDMPLETMQSIVTMQQPTSGQYETLPHEAVFYRPGLLHAYAGRVIAQQDFGIQDEDILRSIELHTTGGERMTVLNKVIFVADYIEPGRSFRGVEKARKIARSSLDEAVLYIYRATMGKLVSKGVYICINTLLGYNEQVLACRDDASLKHAGTSHTLQGV